MAAHTHTHIQWHIQENWYTIGAWLGPHSQLYNTFITAFYCAQKLIWAFMSPARDGRCLVRVVVASKS